VTNNRTIMRKFACDARVCACGAVWVFLIFSRTLFRVVTFTTTQLSTQFVFSWSIPYYKCTEECETQPEAAPEGICTMRPDEISRGPKASSTRFGPRTFTITFSMSATAPAVQTLEGVQL
jgi:hypothetical protein